MQYNAEEVIQSFIHLMQVISKTFYFKQEKKSTFGTSYSQHQNYKLFRKICFNMLSKTNQSDLFKFKKQTGVKQRDVLFDVHI